MRILVLMLIGLLAAGNAAADRDRDRGGYYGGKSYSELKRGWQRSSRAKRSWRSSTRRYASARLNYLRASSMNAGVCDALEGSSRSLRMMCIAFCELQSCSPDMAAEDPFENCSRSSKWIYNRYEKKRGAGDPDLPCVQQPIVEETAVAVSACPCWSGTELAGYLDWNPSDATSCTVDGGDGVSQQNFDTVAVSGAGMLNMSSFGLYQGSPTCALYETGEDGSRTPVSRLLPISAEQALACEADIANVVARRGATCN